MRRIRGVIFRCALGALPFLLHTDAQAVSYGVNLLVNGDAEAGSSSGTGAPVSVPGWTTSSAFTVIPYGSPGYPSNGDPGPPDRGTQFFGGGNAALSTATQEIDLTANAADINAGNVVFNLTGWFGGFQADNDNASLTATFFDGATPVGLAAAGDVTAFDRSSATGLLFQCGSGLVPANTTRAVITLTMSRFSGGSNDGYADSLAFVCTLGSGAPMTVATTFAGAATIASASGPWSDSNHWSPQQVPSSCGNTFYSPTITGVTLSGTLSNENRVITRTFGAVNLDVNATVEDLTLESAGLTDGGLFIFDHEHTLTVTGTTTDHSLESHVDTPGFAVETHNAQATLSLGHFTNFSAGTLSGTALSLFAGGPAATIQFRGADIVTLQGTGLSLTGSNTHIIDESGNDGLRHFAVIGTGAALTVQARDFVTPGDLTITGALDLLDDGLDTSLTVGGTLTNFDASTHTLTGGTINIQRFGLNPAVQVILRFPGADIVNNAASISLSAPTAQIHDQLDRDGLRNLAHNLAAGALSFRDRDFTSAGAFTNDGSLSVEAQSQSATFDVNGTLGNFDAGTRTLTGGSIALFGTASGTPATATLRFHGADIVHNASSIRLANPAAILDESNANGLRNFVDNQATGQFELLGTPFTAPSDFTNAGLVTLDNFDPAIVFSVAGGHDYIQTAGETALDDSVLTAAHVSIQGGILHRGGTINGDVSVAAATIAPTGTGGGGFVNLGGEIIVVPGSTLIPGPDTMTINGNLTLSPEAHLSLVIRGTPQGEFDTMTVTGSVAFGGTLEVTLLNAFAPQPSDSFTVLTAGPPITGAFANVANGSRIQTTDGRASFIATYGDNHLVLSNFDILPPSDLDDFVFYSTKTTKRTPKLQPFGPVTLTDTRGAFGYDVKALLGLGLPADRNGGGIFDAVTHLARYAVKRHKGAPKFHKIPDVPITTECGALVLTLLKPDTLLVPVREDPATAPPPPDPLTSVVDHFLCYKAKTQKKRTDGTRIPGLPKKIQLDAADHFQTRRYDVKKITRLCVPVATSGQPVVLKTGTAVPITATAVRRAANQLVCYKVKRAKKTIAQTTCGPTDPKAKGTKIVPPQPKHQKRVGLLIDGSIGSASLDTRTELELCAPLTGTLPAQ